MDTKLIGLTGFAGSGKDEVRAVLRSVGYIGFAFADPIRSMIADLLAGVGECDGWIEDRALKEQVIPALGVSYRQMAQTLGTAWGRALRPDFWIRIAAAYMTDIQTAQRSPFWIDDDEPTPDRQHFCISDVRFENEAAWVRAQGGVIWRVHREGLAAVRAHASESEQDSIRPARTIHNNGTLDDLRVAVLEALGVVA